MQHAVSEENHNKYIQYSRSVGRDRNIGPATVKPYQLTVAFFFKVTLRFVLAVHLYFIVNNYGKNLDFRIVTVKIYAVFLYPAVSLLLLKAKKSNNFHKFNSR